MQRAEWVDFTAFPVLIIRLPVQFSVVDVSAMYNALEELTERDGKYTTIVDSTALTFPPGPMTRRALVRGGAAIEAHAQKYCIGTALVIHNTLVRGALTAFNWVRGDKFALPEIYTATMDEARRWSRKQLEANRAMTPAARAYFDQHGL